MQVADMFLTHLRTSLTRGKGAKWDLEQKTGEGVRWISSRKQRRAAKAKGVLLFYLIEGGFRKEPEVAFNFIKSWVSYYWIKWHRKDKKEIWSHLLIKTKSSARVSPAVSPTIIITTRSLWKDMNLISGIFVSIKARRQRWGAVLTRAGSSGDY